MELGGTEKRIQALFSELSHEDSRHLPRFEQLWRRAETTRPAPVRAVSRSLAVTVAVVIVAASSFALWSRYTSIQVNSVLNITAVEIPTTALPQVTQLATVVESSRAPYVPRQRRTFQQRQTEGFATSEVAQLSRWQSPTQSFMQLPTGTRFNSLPQLNQSAKDLESFLPKTNEVKKESNR